MAKQPADSRTKPRQQVAALPYQARAEGTLVMLVTSRETGRWVLPKGWPKKRLTHAESAAMEAYEEAGLVGDMATESIGLYSYAKLAGDDHSTTCVVAVFPLRVVELLSQWPECTERRRQWFTLTEAARVVDEGDLKVLLRSLAATGAENLG